MNILPNNAILNGRPHNEYLIVWFEPNLHLMENDLIKKFANSKDVLEFTQRLISQSIGFILIVSEDSEQQDLFQELQKIREIFSFRLSKSEEEMLFKKLFKDNIDKNTLPIKAYVFSPRKEFKNEAPANNKEEVLVMQEIKKMAKEFKQEFLIWYDSNISLTIKEEIENSLGVITGTIFSYNFDALFQKIHNPPKSSFHLILTSEDEAVRIKTELGDFVYRMSIKVYNPQRNFAEFLSQTKVEIETKLRMDLPAFMTTFDACDKQNIYNLHVFLHKFNFQNRRQAKRDFINLAQEVFPRMKERKIIYKFAKTYKNFDRRKILRWYSETSPVNKLINNSLRIATPDSITYARFVLRDLEMAIRKQYKRQSKKFSGIVYRAAYISEDEWIKFERNQGQEVEMLGFLSTSKRESLPLRWVNDGKGKVIMMEIIIPPLPELDPQGFADITTIAVKATEEEILFNVRSRFQIIRTEVVPESKECREHRRVLLLYGNSSLSSYIMRNKSSKRTKLESPLHLEHKCQKCLNKENLFFEYQETKQFYCKRCLPEGTSKYFPLEEICKRGNSNPPHTFRKRHGWKCDECEKIARRVYYLEKGNAAHKQCLKCSQGNKERKLDFFLLAEENPKTLFLEDNGDYEMAMLDFQSSSLSTNEKVTQGELYFEVEKYEECLEYCQKRLEQIPSKSFSEQERLRLYDLMGKSSKFLGKGEEAKEYLLQNLIMTKSVFGENHQRSAISLHNLAVVLLNFGDLVRRREHLNFSRTLSG